MVAQLLRLRFDLLVGALRGDARQLWRTLLGLGLVIAFVAGGCWAMLRLRETSDDVSLVVTVIAGGAITFAFLLSALVVGVDDQLDPRRFAVFGLPPLHVAGAVLLASTISVPVLALIALGISLAVLWIALGASAALTIVAVTLGILTCMLLAKIASTVSAMVLKERRSRELTGVLLVGVLVVVVPLGVFFASLEWGQRVPSALEEASTILARTPLGAAWAIPGLSLRGAAGPAIVVAVLTVLVLGVLWLALAQRALTTTERPTSLRERRGLGWFNVTSTTPAGAVAARSLVYGLRDPRYIVNTVIVPVAAAVAALPLILVGVPVEIAVLLPAPIMALLFGWLPHNDLAYDSTALWMHLAAGLRGAADRAGRLAPVALVAVPLLALTIPVTILIHDRWAVLPAMIGVCLSLFLCGLGLSSLSSVLAPYAVSRPGDSPFQQPQRTGGGLAQGVVLVGAVVLSIPVLWGGWLTLTEDVAAAWPTLWAGMATGVAVLLLGIFGGGAVFDRRGSRLMEFAEAT